MINRMPAETDNLLGNYLRDRRIRLDPAAFGFAVGRRRTPGLRREEVAQRSNISPTWYTWLEQGRGGAPSADVLNRIAGGLMLTEPEREHLFMLGLGRPPEIRYKAVEGVTPRLQRLLDMFEVSPALIKTATWDVVAWNRAAAVVLTDYGALPPRERNILRLIFSAPRVRAAQDDALAGLSGRLAGGDQHAQAGGVDQARPVELDHDGFGPALLDRGPQPFQVVWRGLDVDLAGQRVRVAHALPR